jgi:hypothetical protein
MTALWQEFVEFGEEGALEPSVPQLISPEPALTATEFPAWLLLRQPGLAQQLAADLPRGSSPGEERYRCAHRWLQARRAGKTEEETQWRRALKQSHEGLFRYLKQTV